MNHLAVSRAAAGGKKITIGSENAHCVSAGAISVREKQREALLHMLRSCVPPDEADRVYGAAHQPSSSGGQEIHVWKVLVYDSSTRDTIAPLLRVADLRAHGVTLHMMIGSSRQPIPDVPAVYLVSPTSENITRIAQDVRNSIYSSLWINFISSIPRVQLEALADAIAGASSRQESSENAVDSVARIYDMYADFCSLEDDLFSLNIPNTFTTINARNVTDSHVKATIDRILERLFCVLVTLGVVPVLRAQRGGPAEMVATMLEQRIREALSSGSNIFAQNPRQSSSFAPAAPRPLLVLLDRTVDIPVMLHHTWTYRALAHDSLSLNLNRVSVPAKHDSFSGGGPLPKPKTFDLDNSDEFWSTNAGLPFPMVAEAVESALQSYKREVEDLNQSAQAVGTAGEPVVQTLSNAGDAALSSVNPSSLATAISSLPQLSKQKQMIDLHTNIATALLESIKERALDRYYQLEEELLARPQSFDVDRILALLRDSRGSPVDKMRLFLIYYLCIEGAPDEHLSQCRKVLAEGGCTDLRSFEYLKSIKAFTSTMASVGSMEQANISSGINSSYAAVLGTLSQVASNVHNLILSADKALPTARVISTLMNQKGEVDVLEGYATLDPKGPKGGGPTAASKRVFEQAIVFVVGPGNYIEYQNCKDYICSQVITDGGSKRMIPNGKCVIYGATELCNGGAFLQQLQTLGGPEATPMPER